MTDRKSTEYLVEKYHISYDLAASAQTLGKFLVAVLDVKASKTRYQLNTWRRLEDKLHWRAADLQPCDFRASYLNFVRNASYRYLPVAAGPLFDEVEAGRIATNEAASLISACIDINMSTTFNKGSAQGPLVQDVIERLLS